MYDCKKITLDVTTRIQQHQNWKFMSQLYFVTPTLPVLTQTPLGETISTLCAIANGNTLNADKGEVLEMCQDLMETLYSTPLDNTYQIPSHFWQTDLGRIVSAAQSWALGKDELVPLSDAADELFGGRAAAEINKLTRLITKHKIAIVPDSSEPNSRKNKRIRRADLEELKGLI